jgi:hypothetical protein
VGEEVEKFRMKEKSTQLRTFKLALQICKIRLTRLYALKEAVHSESLPGPTWQEWKEIDPDGTQDSKRESDEFLAFMEKRMRLRTLRVVFQCRKNRSQRYHARGEALAGPTWQVSISQLLEWNKFDPDAGQKSDEFLAFMEKLLLRERKDPSNGKVVSMLKSASRFFPLFDQRAENGEILYNAHAQQCLNHGLNNITNACMKYLDHEFLDRIIQAIRCVKSLFNESELMAAINHFFNEQPNFRRIDDVTTFFREAREGIEKQAARKEGVSLEEAKKEMGYTDERGAQTPETCAIVRWSTTTNASDWMARYRLGYAVGFLRIGAVALDPKHEVDAVIAVFSHVGFQSEKFPDLMLENKVAESFEFLSGSRTTLQMYIVSFLHRFIFKPLMALISADKE